MVRVTKCKPMNEPVGYKRPPASTRFQRGRSGNPTGRPKRAPSFSSALLAELAETMPGRNQERAGSKLQALVRKIVDSAIAGDARAQAMLVGALARLGDVEADDQNAIAPDDREILDAYVGGEVERRANRTNASANASDEKA